MTVGTKIKNALQKVATPYIILRDSGDVSGEYVDLESNAQVTKPFIREFFLEGMMSYDTVTVPGDVISLTDSSGEESGTQCMLMNQTPANYAGEAMYKEVVLYKCNVSGELSRPSGERDTTSYLRDVQFESVRSSCYGLLTDNPFGVELQDDPIGLLDVKAMTLFVPSSVGIRELDRYAPSSGEYYKVETVRLRDFPGVHVCKLTEDTR